MGMAEDDAAPAPDSLVTDIFSMVAIRKGARKAPTKDDILIP